jgi:hypothetical protein
VQLQVLVLSLMHLQVRVQPRMTLALMQVQVPV